MNPIDFLSHQMMIPILNAFYSFTHSYGMAIILLTVTIKAALFPLTAKQFKASRQMQALQPKLVELQAKYKDKPEELQAKMMEFYKDHNANPFSSCLPLLIQMPFLFALYSSLGNKDFQAQIAHKSFLFIQNLAAVGVLPGKDHAGVAHGLLWDNLILVIFFGISTYVMQKTMTTNPDDPMQKQMLTMMPVMMTVMFLFFPLPSGILLYIAVSNLITLAQNILLMRANPVSAAGPSVPASKAVIDTTPTIVKDDSSKGDKK
ncbi:MAG TPA: YidC/Oxa1 family membrane protein insertase [Pantanalinema sp.]